MKIKKLIKLFITILIVISLILLVKKILLKKYNITYENNKFKVNEIYSYENKKNSYEINIKKNKLDITYMLDEDFNKHKKIIKDIKLYKENNITCIMPTYRKKIENRLYCLEDNKQVSNYYLRNNQSYKKIVKKLKKYKINIIDNSTKKTKYKNIEVYENNISSEDIFTLWDYKGVYVLEKDENKYIKFLDYDLYDDIKTAIFDKYFVLFENNHVDGIKNIYYYDLKKNKLKIYNPEIIITKDFYINGVFNNLIYVTDNKTKKEYSIDIKKEKIEQVNKSNEYLVYLNNKEYKLNKSDYFMENQLFKNKKVIDSKVSNSELIKENNTYYFIENNNFYRQISSRNKELLFSLDNIKEWKIYDKKILIVSEDKLYLYDDKYGLKTIIESNELKYNYKNICDYKEKK